MHLIYESYLKYILWGKWNIFLKNWSEFELTFINKSKGDVRQQVLKRSFCLNYRFFPPGDNFNAHSYSVGDNVIMAYSSAYTYIQVFGKLSLYHLFETEVITNFFRFAGSIILTKIGRFQACVLKLFPIVNICSLDYCSFGLFLINQKWLQWITWIFTMQKEKTFRYICCVRRNKVKNVKTVINIAHTP